MREPGGQVLQHARPHLHAPALAAGERANAVVLLLEDPLRSFDDARREGREHRANEPHAGSPVAAFATLPPSSRAIPARSRRVRTDRGFAAGTSTVDADRSRRFMGRQLRSTRPTAAPGPL